MAINIDHTKHLISPNASTTIKFDTTGSIVIPVGTQSQRPGTAIAGALRFNTNNSLVEYYDGAAWNSFLSDGTFTSFSTISVAGQDSLVADSSLDTLTLVEGTGIQITTNATTDTLTITLSANIDDLGDVDTSTTAPTAGQVLVWDTVGGKWIPGDAFSQTDFDDAFALKNIDDLADVDTSTTAPTNGQALLWNGTTWTPGTVSVANALDDLTDVLLSSPAAGEILKYTGTEWVNSSNNLSGLSDVAVSTPVTDGYVLKYNATSGKWQPAADNTGGGGGGGSITIKEINSLGDVETVTNVNTIKFDADGGFDVVDLGLGEVKITMNSTFKYWEVDGQDTLEASGLDTIKFVAGTGIVITTNITADPKEIEFGLDAGLDDLTDVDVAGATNGQVLKYNSTSGKWEPGTDLTASGGTGSTGTLLDELSPDGVIETFDLTLDGNSYTPQSSENLIVTINGVYQVPYQAYEVIGDQITFAEALESDDLVCIVEMAGGGSGGGGISSITLKENGTAVGTATTLNFIGADVTVGSGTGTITITGAGVNSNLYRYAITSTTSTLSGLDDNSVTLDYQVEELAVYVNGIRLRDGEDYTATDGTSISFTSDLTNGDYVEIEAYNPGGGGGGGGGASAIDDLTDVRTSGAYAPTNGQALVWNASASQWQPGTVSGGSGSGSVAATLYRYSITSTTDTVTGSDDDVNTLSYTANNLSIFLNGIRLKDGADYTATDGTSVVFAVDLLNGDYVEIETYGAAGTDISTASIDELADVRTTGSYAPSNGQALVWNASASQWEPGTVSGGGGGSIDITRYQYSITGTTTTISGPDDNTNTLSYTSDNLNVYLNGIRLSYGNDYTATSGSSVVLAVAVGSGNIVEIDTWEEGTGSGGGASDLDDLTDVVITSPSNGQVLKYNGTSWVNAADATGSSLASIDDIPGVNITSATSGQVLAFDGTNWINSQVSGLHSADTTVYFTTTTTVDTFSKTTYRSAKYLLQATTGTDYHVTEVILLHDDTNVYISEYGTLFTDVSLITVTADISGTDVRLRVTPVGAPTSVKLKRIDIEV